MSIISKLLDLIYPPLCCSCGAKLSNHDRFFLCPECSGSITFIKNPVCPVCGVPGNNGECAACARSDYSFTLARAACLYESPASDAVKQFKYGKNLWLSKTLSDLLLEGMKEFPEAASADIIAPVPLARVKEKERGFNQSEILSRAAGRALGKKVSVKNLVRIKHSPPQTKLAGKARRENVRGIFRVHDRDEFRGRDVLLVDDVFTTGATADECSRELLGAGARGVNVFTLAKKL